MSNEQADPATDDRGREAIDDLELALISNARKLLLDLEKVREANRRRPQEDSRAGQPSAS